MNESDGIEEPLEQVLQHGLAVAAQLGREVSRMWQQRMEEKAKLTEREGRRLQMAFDSEKRTAVAVLKPTQEAKWWDQAKPADVIEAYRVANAWKDHDPAAAAAEKNLREQAATRFGIDGPDLARLVNEAAPASPALQVDPARLAEAQQWAAATGHEVSGALPKDQAQRRLMDAFERDQGRQAEAWLSENDPERLNDLRRHRLGFNEDGSYSFDMQGIEDKLMADWKNATEANAGAEQGEANAVKDKAEGNVQSTQAALEYAAADRDKEAAVTAEFDGPNAAEEAWYRDTFLTDSPESQQAQDKSTQATESAKAHEQAGGMAMVHASAAYNSAERQEALAARMRAAGAPEKGIEARQFAESQQKHPIGHAAAGKGKTVNKVKTTAPQKAQTQAKQRSR